MTWSFETAWAIAKIVGIVLAAIVIVTPAFRLWSEGRADRRRARK